VSTLQGVVAHFDFDPPPSIGTTSVDFESITSIGLSAKAVTRLAADVGSPQTGAVQIAKKGPQLSYDLRHSIGMVLMI
jgi:hypothetical protein